MEMGMEMEMASRTIRTPISEPSPGPSPSPSRASSDPGAEASGSGAGAGAGTGAGAWATPDDWARLRVAITQHYRDENMKLKELIEFMDKTYGFRATPKMYKARLAKWRISKNVKASDISIISLASNDDGPAPARPEFYVVGDRLIRADRLQQAMQRRATVARRAMKNEDRHGKVGNGSPSQSWSWEVLKRTNGAPLSPPMTPPEMLRVPESILLNSRGYIIGAFETMKVGGAVVAELKLRGPVQQWKVAFEESVANMGQTTALDQVAFKSLDRTFDMIRSCLLDQDPQFIMVCIQLTCLCLWFNKVELMRILVSYLLELSKVVLGPRHPITLIFRDLKSSDVETSRQIFKLAAEAAWHQMRGYLYPASMDSFLGITCGYSDVLDSLGLYDERESFLRCVVESAAEDADHVPFENQVQMELHLIQCLRRMGRNPDALERLGRLRQNMLMRQSQDIPWELTCGVLRLSGFCECEGGDFEKGLDFLWGVFELMQENKGKYALMTTRALRDFIRYKPEPVEELKKELEDRVHHFDKLREEEDDSVVMT